MTNEEIFAKIDHTLLAPTSVCIPPSYVKQMHEEFPTLNICTVIGFPLGYEVTRAKVVEAEQAVADGANEIDMVVNITAVKNHDFDFVMDEIQAVKRACGDHILKVIVETCYLNEDEKVMLCHSVTTAGADYIKTSTGFGTDGATKDDIKLFSKNIGKNVKMKAAGGIKSREDMEDFIRLGCSRLGTSSGVKLLKNKK